MMPGKFLTVLFLYIVASFIFLTDAYADEPADEYAQVYALGSLSKKIQKELDINPFLKEEGVKLRVIEEVSGYITIEMYEGSSKVRDYIVRDVASLTEWANTKASDADQKVVYVIDKALAFTKDIDGVKDVMLTAVPHKQPEKTKKKRQESPQDAKQLFTKGESLFASGNYPDAAAFLSKSAELGNVKAQYLMGYMHQYGYGMEKNYKAAIKLYRQSIEQGYTKAITSLAWLYATRPDDTTVDIDGDEALDLALKAIEKAPVAVSFDTLAAVYARNGQFDQAIEAEKKAISLNENKNSEFTHRLKLYEDGKYYISE